MCDQNARLVEKPLGKKYSDNDEDDEKYGYNNNYKNEATIKVDLDAKLDCVIKCAQSSSLKKPEKKAYLGKSNQTEKKYEERRPSKKSMPRKDGNSNKEDTYRL